MPFSSVPVYVCVQSQADDFLISNEVYIAFFSFCHLSTALIRRRTRNNPIDLGWSDAITETPSLSISPVPKLSREQRRTHHGPKERHSGKHSKLFYSKSPWLLLWMTSPIGGLEILARWKTNLLFIPHESTWPLDRQKYHPLLRSAAIVVLANILRTLRCKVRKWSNSGQEQNWIGLSLRTKPNAIAFRWFVFLLNGEKVVLSSLSHTPTSLGVFVGFHYNPKKRVPLFWSRVWPLRTRGNLNCISSFIFHLDLLGFLVGEEKICEGLPTSGCREAGKNLTL